MANTPGHALYIERNSNVKWAGRIIIPFNRQLNNRTVHSVCRYKRCREEALFICAQDYS